MSDGLDEESLEPPADSGSSDGFSENDPAAFHGTAQVIPPEHPNPRYRHLKPWKKGQSGNPSGKPKRGPLTDALALIADKKTPEELLAKIPPGVAKVLGKKPTLAQILMFRLMYAAIAGDVGATRLIFERLEGKVPAEIHTADTGQLDALMEVLSLGGTPPGELND